jgi:hypothetical protein
MIGYQFGAILNLSFVQNMIETPIRILQDWKNIELFMQWFFSTKGYQLSISRFSSAN